MRRRMVTILALAAATLSSPALAWKSGDWVLGRWQGGEYWFPGVVEKDNGKTVTIAYDDGTKETRPAKDVRRYDWIVGSNIQCVWPTDGKWYAATIRKMADDGAGLVIKYEDGTVEQTSTGKCRTR